MVTTQLVYLGLLAAVGVERLVEVVVAKRNAAWSLARGGVEHGAGHYPVMVLLHTGLLVGAAAEVVLLDRPFAPVVATLMTALALGCQALRWWCIRTLGPRWNTRVIVVPGLPRVTTGPYRWMEHPNYVAVALEGMALPLIHGAWLTAALFSVANAFLLLHRVRVEDAALRLLDATPEGG